MDRGAWWATVHGVEELDTTKRLKHLNMHAHAQAHTHTHTQSCYDLNVCVSSKFTCWNSNLEKREVAQLCLTLCDPMDCSWPGSFIHGIFQTRILEGVAFSFSRGSSQSRDRTQVSHTARRLFTIWATREAQRWMYLKARSLKVIPQGWSPHG